MIGGCDTGICRNCTQAQTARAYTRDDTHDTRVEGELQDDTRRPLGGYREGTHVRDGGAMQQETDKEEEHDDRPKVKHTMTHKQPDDEVRKPQ